MRPRPLCARLVIATALALAASPAAARTDDTQLWLQTNVAVPVAHDLRVTIETIARTSDNAGGLYQTEVGALLGYRLSDDIELGFGYRGVGAHNGVGDDEDRLRQQVVATFGGLTTRLRVDERFNPRGGEIGFRIRPLVRYNRPVGRGVALFASHESFFLPNTTAWGQRAGYERMRNIVGVVLPLARIVSADVGYLNQYRFARGGAPARADHALTVQLTIDLARRRGARIND